MGDKTQRTQDTKQPPQNPSTGKRSRRGWGYEKKLIS